MSERRAGQRGYVLFELMTAVALLALAVSSIADLRHRAAREASWAADYATDLAELRRSLAAIEDDVRSATAVRALANGIAVTLQGGTASIEHDGTQLVRTLGGRSRVLARCIAEFAVATDGATARVGLTLRRRAHHDRPGPTVWSTIALRNRRQS